eukprot:6971876-Alexandrium_andersonii.AAC.1
MEASSWSSSAWRVSTASVFSFEAGGANNQNAALKAGERRSRGLTGWLRPTDPPDWRLRTSWLKHAS